MCGGSTLPARRPGLEPGPIAPGACCKQNCRSSFSLLNIRGYGSRLKAGTTPLIELSPVGWVEPLAKPIVCAAIDGYRFAPPILRARVYAMIHVSPLSALDAVTTQLQNYDL